MGKDLGGVIFGNELGVGFLKLLRVGVLEGKRTSCSFCDFVFEF